MKLLVFILAAGLVSANISSEVGHEHLFKYNGKILTGLPDIDAHFAGVTIACDVLIQVVEATTFKLAMKNVAFSKFHQRLEGPTPMNWRTLVTPVPAPVDADLLPFLESPIVFKMVNGKMTNIEISSNEPQWTVNMKKALLDLIKIQYPVIDNHIQQNIIVNSLNVIPNFFQVMEEGIDGICENTYTVTELPAYLVKDPTSWTTDLLKPKLCLNKKIFQITKVRDANKCQKHNLYVSRTKMEKVIKAEAHMTKYVGCGTTKENLMIHAAIHEGEIVQRLTNIEPMVTGIKQVLHLVEVRPTLTQLPAITIPRILNTFLYEFPLKSDVIARHAIAAPFAKGTATPANWEAFRAQIPGLRVDSIRAKIVKELKEIAIDVAQVENVAHKKLTTKLMNVLRSFLMLTTEEIKALHTDIKNLAGVELEVKQAVVALFMDTATMAGTPHSVEFLKHIVESEQVNEVRILTTIMTLGHHIRTPTVEILNHIFAMVQAPVVLKNKVIKHNALLNFANLLNKACIAKDDQKRFPVEVFGEFCTSATAEIATTYVPYILNEFKSTNDEEYKEVCLIALGTLGHEAVVPLLIPYIQGKVAGNTVPMRVMTILALNNVMHKHRDILIPVYMAILDNPVEHRHVRIAALSMILKAEPTFVMIQKIAISTWHEKDPEMVKFIFATLKSLSLKEFENMAHFGSLKKIAGMARTVLPLAKPLPGMLFYSGNAFITEYLKHLYTGFEAQAVFTFSPHGNTVFNKMVVLIDQVKLPALELALNLKGEKSLFDQLHQVFAEVVGIQIESNNEILNSLHAEWKKIVQEMKFKAREDIPFHTFLYMNIFDDIVAHIGANQLTLDALKPWIKKTVGPIIKDPRAAMQAFCNKKIPINLIHAARAMSTEVVHVSGLGLPIVTEIHAPHLVAVQGHIELTDCGAGLPTVVFALKTKVFKDFYTSTSIVVPFTKEIASVNSAAYLFSNKPIKVVIKVEPTTQKLIVKVAPFVAPTATAVDAFHYHVQAFTAIKKVDVFAFGYQQAHLKQIRVMTTPTKIIKKIGGPVGLDLALDIETDSELLDWKTIVDRAAMFKYNPANLVIFPFQHLMAAKRSGMPSVRFHKMTVMYNHAKSTTKEVHFNVELAIAKMLANVAPVQYKIQYTPNWRIIEAPLTQANPIEVKLLSALKDKLNVKTNFAMHTLFHVILKGGADRTFALGMTAGLGLDSSIKKWHVHMEVMPQTIYAFHVCTDGHLDKPVIPAWNIEKLLTTSVDYNFKKTIGFGKTCDEFQINLNGVASVSEQQKTFSKKSHEAVLCQKSKQLNLKHPIQGLLPTHVACHMQRDQAATIDHVVLNMQFVKLPPTIGVYQKTFVGFMKLLVLPHIEMNPFSWMAEPLTSNGVFKTTVQFNPALNTFTLNVITPAKTISFNNIRLPWALHGVLPLVAVKMVHEQVHEALTATPFRPTCHVTETGHIQTFDERFYNYEMDDCYHVVAADCTAKFTTAVLAKTHAGMKHAKVFHMDNEFKLEFPAVFLNGQPIEIPQNFEKVIMSSNGLYAYTIKRTVDDVFILDTPAFVVQYNGQRIQVKSKQIKITGQMCGLCGDNNKDSRFDLKSPTTCIYKSDLLAALSYRHQTPECRVLPKEQIDLIAAEEAQCAKSKISSPQPQMQMEIGWSMKHYTIKDAMNALCISQRPLYSCLPSYISKSSIQMMVPYTCLIHPSNKVVKRYEQNVMSGAILPELRLMDTHMTIPTTVPQYCSKL